MVTFKYSLAHGTAEVGEERQMFKSTAEALAKVGVGEITVDEKVTEEVEATEPEPIKTTAVSTKK